MRVVDEIAESAILLLYLFDFFLQNLIIRKMKTRFMLLFTAILLITVSCGREKPIDKVIDESFAFSVKQYGLMTDTMKHKPDMLPRTIDAIGNLKTSDSRWWTSGFYPGCLWYLYEYSKDPKIKTDAAGMTARVEREKFTTSNHDVGFMLYCSFGNGLRLTGEEKFNEVLLTGAKSLSTRFRPDIGCIQSWGSRKGWQCPVIIDNMMNLELLMWAFKKSGDSSFYKIAVSHADTTIKYHFRPDYSTYHVVSYDTITGKVEARQTAQGFSDSSAWSRGQSWGLYGYTMMYRETGLDRYLQQARHIAGFLIDNPNLPEDKIPYWDYNAPGIPNATRDASAGAIMASALVELSSYVDKEEGNKYLKVAETQIRTLASPLYMAKLGKNGNFILMHSVGSLPGNSEVDVPLTYADYYFIEAMMRYRKNLK
jgi:unsaturated chondroitin disaccharide hydrolase